MPQAMGHARDHMLEVVAWAIHAIGHRPHERPQADGYRVLGYYHGLAHGLCQHCVFLRNAEKAERLGYGHVHRQQPRIRG